MGGRDPGRRKLSHYDPERTPPHHANPQIPPQRRRPVRRHAVEPVSLLTARGVTEHRVATWSCQVNPPVTRVDRAGASGRHLWLSTSCCPVVAGRRRSGTRWIPVGHCTWIFVYAPRITRRTLALGHSWEPPRSLRSPSQHGYPYTETGGNGQRRRAVSAAGAAHVPSSYESVRPGSADDVYAATLSCRIAGLECMAPDSLIPAEQLALKVGRQGLKDGPGEASKKDGPHMHLVPQLYRSIGNITYTGASGFPLSKPGAIVDNPRASKTKKWTSMW